MGRVQGIGVDFTEDAAPARQGVRVQVTGFGVAAHVQERPGEIVRGHQRVLMILPEPLVPLLAEIAHEIPRGTVIAALEQIPAQAANELAQCRAVGGGQVGNKFYLPPPGDAFMPIEFGGACYRFGHSQVRPSYRANFTSGTGDSTNPAADPFFGLVFDATEPEFNGPVNYDRDDLLGGYPAANRYIGWQTFFDFGDGQVKNNKKIDTTISSVLYTLPVPAIAPHTQTSPTVPPQRHLLRQLTWSVPSGQSVGLPPVHPVPWH